MAQYTYDPTQQKIVPLAEARVVTYITTDPQGLPSKETKVAATVDSPLVKGLAAITKQLKDAQAAYDAAVRNKESSTIINKAKIRLDEAKKGYALSEPQRTDVREADPDVKSGRALIAKAQAAVDSSKQDIADAKAALAETIAINESYKSTAAGVTPVVVPEEPKAPGKAWVKVGKDWVKPEFPSDGKSYKWDDNEGWVAATTADVVAQGSGVPTEENGAVVTEDGTDVIPEEVIPPRPGEAYVWNSTTKNWDRAPKPEGPGYSWDDDEGWFQTTVAPGSTGAIVGSEKVLAIDTFKNTFALIFGAKEAGQSYVNKLYDLTSGFYKTGSTQEEAMNLAIRQAYNENAIPEFTKRFAGIFALDAKLKAGEAVSVPTIAEFFAAEAEMGDKLTRAGLGDLATQEFLGDVIGRGKSVLEVTNLISDAFNTIDNAPQALKDTLKRYYPAADRVSLAKAMLMGPEGAAALEKKIKGISVLSAAETQGITTDLTQASDIAAMGYTYNQSLVGFGEVSKLKRAGTLAQIGGTEFTQQQAQNAVFAKNAADLAEIDRLEELEKSRFGGKAGTMGSKSFASQQRGAGLI
jgi:hypothetical protein